MTNEKFVKNAILELDLLKKRIIQLEESITGNPRVDQLADVDTTGLADGHILLYEQATLTWKTVLLGTTMMGWSGQVDVYANLPPAGDHTGEIWLVTDDSGIWLINRQLGGLYESDGITWNRIGTLSDFFNDQNFEIYDDADNSKKVKFDASVVGSGQTRTYTWPDKSGTVALLDDTFIFPNQAILELVEEPFLTADKNKLDGIEAGATADQIAAEVPFNPATSSLTATDVQGMGEEVAGRLDLAETAINALAVVVEDEHQITINQVGHGFTLASGVPLPAYLSGGLVTLAQANTPSSLTAFFITEIIDVDNFVIKPSGIHIAPGHGLTVGDYYFLDPATPGGVINTVPTATQISDVCFYIASSDRIILKDNRPFDNESLNSFIFKASNTDTVTDINTAVSTPIPLIGSVDLNQSNYYGAPVGNTGVPILNTRTYRCKANIHVFSNNSIRPNLRVQFNISGGANIGHIAATGYIRNGSGHEESSYHLDDILLLSAGQVLQVVGIQEANALPTVTMAVSGSSNIILEAL